MYQSEVLGQRLNTRDELGFGMRWCCEDVDEDWSSHEERIVGDVDGFNSPLPKGSIPGEIAPPESKSAPAQVPPQDSGATSRKPSLIFSRAKGFM